jgi:hypothetical protein
MTVACSILLLLPKFAFLCQRPINLLSSNFLIDFGANFTTVACSHAKLTCKTCKKIAVKNVKNYPATAMFWNLKCSHCAFRFEENIWRKEYIFLNNIFSNYSFQVHHPAIRDDRHPPAHAMASDFSVAWQFLSMGTIGFLLWIKLHALI